MWLSMSKEGLVAYEVFRSVKELEKAIRDFIDKHNEKPKIFTWTKDADTILAKVAKCKELLGTGH